MRGFGAIPIVLSAAMQHAVRLFLANNSPNSLFGPIGVQVAKPSIRKILISRMNFATLFIVSGAAVASRIATKTQRCTTRNLVFRTTLGNHGCLQKGTVKTPSGFPSRRHSPNLAQKSIWRSSLRQLGESCFGKAPRLSRVFVAFLFIFFFRSFSLRPTILDTIHCTVKQQARKNLCLCFVWANIGLGTKPKGTLWSPLIHSSVSSGFSVLFPRM